MASGLIIVRPAQKASLAVSISKISAISENTVLMANKTNVVPAHIAKRALEVSTSVRTATTARTEVQRLHVQLASTVPSL